MRNDLETTLMLWVAVPSLLSSLFIRSLKASGLGTIYAPGQMPPNVPHVELHPCTSLIMRKACRADGSVVDHDHVRDAVSAIRRLLLGGAQAHKKSIDSWYTIDQACFPQELPLPDSLFSQVESQRRHHDHSPSFTSPDARFSQHLPVKLH